MPRGGPDELARARRLAEDAYWVEFESSDMETAVNKYLGYVRAGELERQFHAISWLCAMWPESVSLVATWPSCATRCFSTCSRSRPRSTPRE